MVGYGGEGCRGRGAGGGVERVRGAGGGVVRGAGEVVMCREDVLNGKQFS